MRAGLFISFAVISFVTFFMSVAAATASATGSDKFSIFAYVPEYRNPAGIVDFDQFFRLGASEEEASKSPVSLIFIFFSFEVRANGALAALDRMPSPHTAKRVREAADRNGGQLWLGFGGNARSHGFGAALTNKEATNRFIRELDDLMNSRLATGIDLNFEYPANVAEWEAWRDCMRRIKREIRVKNAAGESVPPLISFTIYLDPQHFRLISHFDMLADDVADFVLCMSYDQSGKHATIPFYDSAWRELKKYKNLPARKFINSVPFYSRDMRTGEPRTYNELVPKIQKRYEKQLAKAGSDGAAAAAVVDPFSADVADRDKSDVFVGKKFGHQYLNSRATIAWKTRRALEEAQDSGVMIWELLQDRVPIDAGKSLLPAIGDEVRRWRREQQEQKKKDSGDL